MLACAFAFSIHILVIDHFTPYVDGVRMSCIQFFTCSALCAVAMFLFEKPSLPDILSAWLPILYAGVLSSGVGYTLQIIAQKNTSPTMASLLMSLESVFAVLAGWVLLGQALSAGSSSAVRSCSRRSCLRSSRRIFSRGRRPRLQRGDPRPNDQQRRNATW